MRSHTTTLLFLSCLCLSLQSLRASSIQLSEEGGNWHSPTTWKTGQVPTPNTDLNIHGSSPMNMSTGTVTIGGYYMWPKSTGTSLRVAPLAHLNITRYFAVTTSKSAAPVITVEGSLMLHRDVTISGAVPFNVKGGYVHSLARRFMLKERYGQAPTVSVTDAGSIYVKQVCTDAGTKIQIDNGEVRFDGIECVGETTIDIANGKFAVSEIDGAAHAVIILRDKGEFLLPGEIDATTLNSRYPGLKITDGTTPLTPDQLQYQFAIGPARFLKYTRITRR
jgi:hypothetical protein